MLSEAVLQATNEVMLSLISKAPSISSEIRTIDGKRRSKVHGMRVQVHGGGGGRSALIRQPAPPPNLEPAEGRPQTAADRIVRLNIGGHKYITTIETLTRKGENFFTSLLSGRFTPVKDENGYFFIDRDGAYFGPILEFLRTGDFYIPDAESIAREALFYSIILPVFTQMKLRRNSSNISNFTSKLQHDGFYLPCNIHEQKGTNRSSYFALRHRGILSNASVLYFRMDGNGYFSDAKEYTWEMKKLDDLTLVTLTCNNLPYNFLFLGGRLSDGSSEFCYCKPEDVQRLQYYNGYISIPETDVTAILFGDSQVFLRFSKRVLVRVGNEKSSLNAGVFHPREYHFLNFETTNVDITICKAASSEVQECCLQILSFSDFLLVRDLKSSSLCFYVFHLAKNASKITLYH